MFLLNHPSSLWLQDVITNMFDLDWLETSLEEIIDSLPLYVSETQYVLHASSILNQSMELILERNEYSQLASLLEQTLTTFDGQKPIEYSADENKVLAALIHTVNHQGRTNKERYHNEYFQLKLNLAHTYLIMRDSEKSGRQLLDLYVLASKADPAHQLDAYCIILKYKSHGYSLPLDFEAVATQAHKIAFKVPGGKLKASIAIASYCYALGQLKNLKETFPKIFRFMAEDIRDTDIINNISAELNYHLAVIYREQYIFVTALHYLDAASEQYARVNNAVQNVLILNEKALIYALAARDNQLNKIHPEAKPDDFTYAQQWLDEAKKELSMLTIPPPTHEAHINHTQAMIFINSKAYEKAISPLKKNIAIWADQQHDYHLALTYNDIGVAYFWLDNHLDALEWYYKARAKCDGLEEEHAKTLMQTIEGNIKQASGADTPTAPKG